MRFGEVRRDEVWFVGAGLGGQGWQGSATLVEAVQVGYGRARSGWAGYGGQVRATLGDIRHGRPRSGGARRSCRGCVRRGPSRHGEPVVEGGVGARHGWRVAAGRSLQRHRLGLAWRFRRVEVWRGRAASVMAVKAGGVAVRRGLAWYGGHGTERPGTASPGMVWRSRQCRDGFGWATRG